MVFLIHSFFLFLFIVGEQQLFASLCWAGIIPSCVQEEFVGYGSGNFDFSNYILNIYRDAMLKPY